jgi:hypothetical protein
MASRTISQRIILSVSLLALVLISLVSTRAQASAGATPALSNLSGFITNINNNNAGELRGIYVPGVMALPIVQQPSDYAGFVSAASDTVTQFDMVNQFGNTGLLAHNHLAGQYFFLLVPGQLIYLIYGNGEISGFIVTQVLQYQAYEPSDPHSDFRDLDSGFEYSAEEVFRQAYMGARHVTLQTCIAKNGEASWGRLFVIAIPLTQYYVHQNLATMN